MCDTRARLAAEFDRLIASPKTGRVALLEAARALQAHKDSCPECQREAVEIERTRRREGIAV